MQLNHMNALPNFCGVCIECACSIATFVASRSDVRVYLSMIVSRHALAEIFVRQPIKRRLDIESPLALISGADKSSSFVSKTLLYMVIIRIEQMIRVLLEWMTQRDKA